MTVPCWTARCICISEAEAEVHSGTLIGLCDDFIGSFVCTLGLWRYIASVDSRFSPQRQDCGMYECMIFDFLDTLSSLSTIYIIASATRRRWRDHILGIKVKTMAQRAMKDDNDWQIVALIRRRDSRGFQNSRVATVAIRCGGLHAAGTYNKVLLPFAVSSERCSLQVAEWSILSVWEVWRYPGFGTLLVFILLY